MAPTIYNVRSEFQGEFHTARPRTLYLVVHHAAANYAARFGIDDVRAIRNYHVNTNGWAGIGYHEVLAEETQGGPIACYVVSDPLTQRAHIWGRNHECFGISCAADFTSIIPEQKWQDALALRLAYHKQRWPNVIIAGHKDIALAGHGTTCPGVRWSAWKGALLASVENLIPPPPPNDPFREWGGIDKPVGAAQSFAIPQLWLKNKATLGACVRGERYDVPGEVSRALFRKGEIRYLADRNVAEVLPYPAGVEVLP